MTESESGTHSAAQTILQYAPMSPGAVQMEPMRAGNFLVIGAKARLPERCLCCNAPGFGRGELIRLAARASLEISWKLEITRLYPAVLLHGYYCHRHLRRQRRSRQRIVVWCVLALLGVLCLYEMDQGGAKLSIETELSNYQPVEGLMIPHSVKQTAASQVITMTIEKVEFNPALDESLFKMPAKK